MPLGRSPRRRKDTHDRTGRKGPRQPPEAAPDTLERDRTLRPPRIAIVGRPNVGKSTLLNALARSRISIVEQTPGVTRDRIEVIATVADRTVELVDTGGIGIHDTQGLERHVEGQVDKAVLESDAILFVVDARDGPQPLDRRVADLLRGVKSPVILLANKAETQASQWTFGEFEALGFGAPMPISAKNREGLVDLEERLAGILPEGPTTPRRIDAPEMKLALVGRVNSGKSSLVNALLQDERMIVSEVPGTTRDSVDVRFDYEDRALVVIDTAGIRKEKVVQDSVDFYAQRRAEKAMRRADVTVLLLDASIDVGRLDRQIAAYAVKHFQPVVIVANKWDLRPEGLKKKAFEKYLRDLLPGLRFSPVIFTSAIKRTGIDALMATAWRLNEQSGTRVGTSQVNKALELAQSQRGPRGRKGRQGNVYYGTQVATHPPTFALFVNDPELFDDGWLRYLGNRLRESLPFPEVALRILLRKRPRDEARQRPPLPSSR